MVRILPLREISALPCRAASTVRYRTSLTRALELHCCTVAFPAISTGVYHYPPQEAAAIAVAECRRFLAEHPDGPEITFVCFSTAMADIYRQLLGSELELSLIHI